MSFQIIGSKKVAFEMSCKDKIFFFLETFFLKKN